MTDEVAGAPEAIAAGGAERILTKVQRPLGMALLELSALCGFAIAQPLLQVLGNSPDFFVYHHTGRAQILLLVAAILLLPTAGLWLAEVAAQLVVGERRRRLLHLALVAGLFTLLALTVGKQLLPIRGRRLALAALLAGTVFAVIHHHWRPVRLWLRYLAPAPLVFALLLVTVSPTSRLVLPHRSSTPSAAPIRIHGGKPLPPVVMIFFDEFPLQSLLDSGGQIDPKVYPNFARFAADATWYRNATGIGGWTPYAVPGMLRGVYPGEELKSAAPDVHGYPNNLFSMFGHYYHLKAFETVTQLCQPGACGQLQLPTAFAALGEETTKLYKRIIWPADVPAAPAPIGEDPLVSAAAKQKGPTAYFSNLSDDQVKRVQTFVQSINADDPHPTLYFLHLLLPHAPWKYLPDGRVYNSDSRPLPLLKRGVWPTALQELNHKQHLLQLAYTDKLVGKLLDRLKQQGLYDKSVVLLTADHGEGFTEGDRTRALGPKNAAQLMWVPMLLKAPHQMVGRVDDRNWEHVDLLPTLADMVGLSVPWKVDGFSQTGPPKRSRTDKTFYNHPGDLHVRPGPPNFAQVLRGVTDTLVKASQHGERGFYQFGATADWIYHPPGAIGPIGGTPVAARIFHWKLFEHVDPKAPLVPSLVAGRLSSGPAPAGSLMVIAVNGQVGATSGFYEPKSGGPRSTFAGLVPDFLYKAGDGRKQIRLYLATKLGGSYRLQPVTISGGD
jgi:hypothetical protein